MELPHIGKNCSLTNCKTLDLLPVNCPYCSKTFCGPHRLPSEHHCVEYESRDKQVIQCTLCQLLVFKPNIPIEEMIKEHQSSGCQKYLYPIKRVFDSKVTKCAIEHCKDFDPRIGASHCNDCNRDFCLKHRYPSTHQCSKLEEDQKEMRRLAAQEQLAKTFGKSASSSTIKHTSVSNNEPPTKKVKKGSPMVELMKIKSKAKGINSVPMASRLYLYIQFPKESKLSLQPMYFDKYDRVGKTLDLLADHCKVSNENHILPSDHDNRLVLYLDKRESNEGLTTVELGSTLEKSVQSMDTLILERNHIIKSLLIALEEEKKE
ncbi:unnamed protein product [Cunninghamella blakesleeana]